MFSCCVDGGRALSDPPLFDYLWNVGEHLVGINSCGSGLRWWNEHVISCSPLSAEWSRNCYSVLRYLAVAVGWTVNSGASGQHCRALQRHPRQTDPAAKAMLVYLKVETCLVSTIWLFLSIQKLSNWTRKQYAECCQMLLFQAMLLLKILPPKQPLNLSTVKHVTGLHSAAELRFDHLLSFSACREAALNLVMGTS